MNKTTHRGTEYPWDRWFSKKSMRLVRGKHFEGQPHGMAQTARRAARIRALRIQIKVDGDSVTVTVKD